MNSALVIAQFTGSTCEGGALSDPLLFTKWKEKREEKTVYDNYNITVEDISERAHEIGIPLLQLINRVAPLYTMRSIQDVQLSL